MLWYMYLTVDEKCVAPKNKLFARHFMSLDVIQLSRFLLCCSRELAEINQSIFLLTSQKYGTFIHCEPKYTPEASKQ